MISKRVDVTFSVSVIVDDTKFTPEFMKKFNETFFCLDDLDEHIKNIAILEAIGLDTDRIEEYGIFNEMGIYSNIVDCFAEIQFDQEEF